MQAVRAVRVSSYPFSVVPIEARREEALLLRQTTPSHTRARYRFPSRPKPLVPLVFVLPHECLTPRHELCRVAALSRQFKSVVTVRWSVVHLHCSLHLCFWPARAEAFEDPL